MLPPPPSGPRLRALHWKRVTPARLEGSVWSHLPPLDELQPRTLLARLSHAAAVYRWSYRGGGAAGRAGVRCGTMMTQEQAMKVARWRTMQEKVRARYGKTRNWSDIAWAWVAEQKLLGNVGEAVYRPMRGGGREPMWELGSTVVSGWDTTILQGVTQPEVRAMLLMEKVYCSLVTVLAKDSGVSREDIHLPLRLEVWSVEKAWQSTKNLKWIQNQKWRFWEALAGLMWMGRVEGHVAPRGEAIDWEAHMQVARVVDALYLRQGGETLYQDEDGPLLALEMGVDSEWEGEGGDSEEVSCGEQMGTPVTTGQVEEASSRWPGDLSQVWGGREKVDPSGAGDCSPAAAAATMSHGSPRQPSEVVD